MVLLILLILFHSGESVVSPLEKISEDVKSLQETIASIQATLMTSVGLIQDQVTEVSQRLTGQFEAKLVSIDKKLDSLASSVSTIKERAGQLDNLRPHLQVLSSRTMEIEQKLEHISRSQADQLGDMGRSSQFKLEGITRKLEEIGSQVQVLDTRTLGLQDKASILPTLLNTVRNITSRNMGGRHRGSSQCQDTKELLAEVVSKIDQLVDKLRVSSGDSGPTFEYLRSHPVTGQQENQSHQVTFEENELESEDAKLSGLIRKIVVPYKRANKRLKDMEVEQGRIESQMTEMEEKLVTSLLDLNRKFGDFSITTTDMFQEHTHTIEGFGKTLAAVLQCCQGTSVDYNRFTASASPILERLDAWMVTWRAEVAQSLEKIQQQESFHAYSIQQGYKELEKILLEGLDNKRADEVPHINDSQDGNHPTTLSTLTTTTQLIVKATAKVDPIQNTDDTVMDCSDLLKSGLYHSKVYRLGKERELNAVQRDYNTRYCELDSAGGGWTIIQRRGDYGEPQVNFTASWEDYKLGFGDIQGEFWFGNDYISRLTSEQRYVLRVELVAWDGRTAYAEYTTFRVDGEDSDYTLRVGGYSGNASDSLSVHNGYKFSTYDRNNDNAPPCCPCAPAYGGGWWFYSCFESNLNGEYFTDPLENGYYRGVIWELWLGDYSLKESRMMIRPRDTRSGTQIPVPPDP